MWWQSALIVAIAVGSGLLRAHLYRRAVGKGLRRWALATQFAYAFVPAALMGAFVAVADPPAGVSILAAQVAGLASVASLYAKRELRIFRWCNHLATSDTPLELGHDIRTETVALVRHEDATSHHASTLLYVVGALLSRRCDDDALALLELFDPARLGKVSKAWHAGFRTVFAIRDGEFDRASDLLAAIERPVTDAQLEDYLTMLEATIEVVDGDVDRVLAACEAAPPLTEQAWRAVQAHARMRVGDVDAAEELFETLVVEGRKDVVENAGASNLPGSGIARRVLAGRKPYR